MTIENIAKQNKIQADEKMLAGVGNYYRQKYGKAEHQELEKQEQMTPQERQEADQQFSAGIFKANQQKNADMLSKLQAAFAGRNKPGGK